MEERRKHKRAILEIPIEMESLDGKHKSFTAQTLNLSAGGFYCRVPFFVPILTKLRISIVVPCKDIAGKEEDHVITCDGMVVRTMPEKPAAEIDSYEIACFFTEIDDYDRLVIEQYLREHVLQG